MRKNFNFQYTQIFVRKHTSNSKFLGINKEKVVLKNSVRNEVTSLDVLLIEAQYIIENFVENKGRLHPEVF